MKIVFATGVSGCHKKIYSEKNIEYSVNRGKKVKVFNIGDMMIQHSYDIGYPLNPKNVLHADKAYLAALRSAVFTNIANEINTSLHFYDAVIINMHYWLFDKDLSWQIYDRFVDTFLNEFPADLYITFIDDFRHISNRLTPREQWRKDKLTYAKILHWQNIEVESTRGLANIHHKPFFALPTGQPDWTLYKLIFHPEIETVYVKMPISHFQKPEEREVINELIRELDKPFNVFNPLSCEVVGSTPVNKFDDEEIQIIDNHVVHRDLDWFVEQCDFGVDIWPEQEVPSPGVDHETHRTYVRTKDEFSLYLRKSRSPFISFFNTGFFKSTEEFFDFIYKKYPERKDLSW